MGERERLESQHLEKLTTILRENRELYNDELARKTDPAEASQVVFLIEEVKAKLSKPKPNDDLSPVDYLAILTSTENWYKERDYPYPHPERLKEQRAHWESRKKEMK